MENSKHDENTTIRPQTTMENSKHDKNMIIRQLNHNVKLKT